MGQFNAGEPTRANAAASAGGKCMIAGEYSVLLPGGWALAVATRGGVTARATPSESWSFQREELKLNWVPGDAPMGPVRFGSAVTEALRRRGVAPLALSTTSGAIGGHGGPKQGLGSSASAVVAMVAAAIEADRRRHASALHPSLLLEIACESHADAQGGRGSGYDVATIATGGLVAFQPTKGEVVSIPWPADLHACLIHTGGSAKTPDRIAAWEALGDVESRATLMEPLSATTQGVIHAFRAGHPEKILPAIAATQDALICLDDDHALGIAPATARGICGAIRAAGAIPRISGAGGGDSILAFASSPAILLDAARRARSAGGIPLDVDLPGPAVQVHGGGVEPHPPLQ